MTSRRAPVWLIVCFALSLPAVTLRLYASDEVQYYSYLRSLWFDRDLSFDNEYRHFYEAGVSRSDLFHATFLEPTTDTGLRISFATLGSAVLWAPFYLAADAVARAGGLPADGYSKPYIAAVCLGSAVYGFLALLMSARIARAIAGDGLAAAIAAWVGTPLLFYMYVAPVFAHATSAFAVTLFVVAWLRARRGWAVRDVVLLGAAGALMTMVREQDVFMTLGPVADYVVKGAGGRGQGAGPSQDVGVRRKDTGGVWGWLAAPVAGIAAFALAYMPQVLAYQTLNGHFGPHKSVSNKMIWTAPHALDVLLSPEHGFFFWTPLAVLAIAGLMWLAIADAGRAPSAQPADAPGSVETHHDTPRDRRWLAVCLLIMFAANVYITGSVDSWSAAGAFGQRRFVNMTPVIVVGLGVLFVRMRAPVARAALVTTIVLCVWWNLALTAQFGAHMMDRHRLELKKNAYNAFVTLPGLAPELAYRYLFERESFYRPSTGSE
jgi:hypothetical protein